MILGVGTDLVAVNRILAIRQRFGERFDSKCFTSAERQYANQRSDIDAFYAKQFAGKEAVLKAVGTGMREGLRWHDIEILRNDLGRPIVSVHGGVLETIKKSYDVVSSTEIDINISLSDERGLALAFVVLSRK